MARLFFGVASGDKVLFREFTPRFSWVCAMSKDSKDMRNRASRELRASRNGGSKEEKAKNVKRAAAYKQLAANEEWLQGEKPRRKP